MTPIDRTGAQLVTEVDYVELPARRAEVVKLVGQILAKPMVYKLVIEAGKTIEVTRWRKLNEDFSTLDEVEFSTTAILASIDLEELPTEGTYKEKLYKAQVIVYLKGFVPTHMVVQSLSTLRAWIELPDILSWQRSSVTNRPLWLGMNIVEETSLPEGVCILLGSGVSTEVLNNAVYGIKFLME